MGGTQPTNPPATETPTPTEGDNKPFTASTATGYALATPTPSDVLGAETPVGKFLYDEAKKGMKFFASRVAEKAISAAATAMVDRAVPTAGADGTAFLSAKDAQHIPGSWLNGLKGRDWNSVSQPYWVYLADSDYPENSLFAKGGHKYVQDTFQYFSPFSHNLIISHKAYIKFAGLFNSSAEPMGGIIPLFAFGVKKGTAKFDDGSTVQYKYGTHLFFKEVFDDWMASRGFDRYAEALDAAPAAGWPGMINMGTPFGENAGFSEDRVTGIKHWSIANEYIAHIEFEGQPSLKQQLLRYPQFMVEGNTTKRIEYPAEARPPRDTFPADPIVPDASIADDGIETRADSENMAAGDPPAPTDTDIPRDEMETDIPVLPSQPPAADDDDDDWAYLRMFIGVDMNVGLAQYYDEGGVQRYGDGAVPVYTAEEVNDTWNGLVDVYGFIYVRQGGANNLAIANNNKPGVMSFDNCFSYQSSCDYYSQMIVETSNSKMRAGIVWLRAGTNLSRGLITKEPFEIRDQTGLTDFEGYGKLYSSGNQTPDEDTTFIDWLAKTPEAKAMMSKGRLCFSFEVNIDTGEGYLGGKF